jgi:hypothetical protein
MKFILFVILLLGLSSSLISQCVDNGNQWAKSWTSCQSAPNPNPLRGDSHWILYEFAESHFIDSSHIWNANRNGESGSGIQNIVVDYSTDGSTWTELGAYTIPRAPETATYQGIAGPDFGSTFIEKILITVVSTHESGPCASIGEMLFAVDASKCHGDIDQCGICNGPGPATWYLDADGDGLGTAADQLVDCQQPFGYVDNDNDICDGGELGWAEISPLFDNSCKGCHIDASAGGLSLSTYESFILGGLNCGPDIVTGQTLVSVITIREYDGCNDPISIPPMNERSSSPLSEIQIDQIQRWVDGGAPEFCTDFCLENDIIDEAFDQGSIAYFKASHDISSSASIDTMTLITFDAGDAINISEGFNVLRGGQFIGRIGGCEE